MKIEVWNNHFIKNGSLSFTKLEYNTTKFDRETFTVDGVTKSSDDLDVYFAEVAALCGCSRFSIGNALIADGEDTKAKDCLNDKHYFKIEKNSNSLKITLDKKTFAQTLKIYFSFLTENLELLRWKIKNNDSVISETKQPILSIGYSDLAGSNHILEFTEVAYNYKFIPYVFKNNLLDKVLYPRTEWKSAEQIWTAPPLQNPPSLTEDIAWDKNFKTPKEWLNVIGGVVDVPLYYADSSKQLSSFSFKDSRKNVYNYDGQFFVKGFNIYDKKTDNALNWTFDGYYPILLYEEDPNKNIGQECEGTITDKLITLKANGTTKTIEWDRNKDKLVQYTRVPESIEVPNTIMSESIEVPNLIKPEFFSWGGKEDTRPNYIYPSYGETSIINLCTKSIYIGKQLTRGSMSCMFINNTPTAVRGDIYSKFKVFDMTNNKTFYIYNYFDENNQDWEEWEGCSDTDIYKNVYSKIIREAPTSGKWDLTNVGDYASAAECRIAIGNNDTMPEDQSQVKRLTNGISLMMDISMEDLHISKYSSRFNNEADPTSNLEANDVSCWSIASSGDYRKLYAKLVGKVALPNGLTPGGKYVQLIKKPEANDSQFSTIPNNEGTGSPYEGSLTIGKTSYSCDWGWNTSKKESDDVEEQFGIKCGFQLNSMPFYNALVLWKKVV